MINEILGQRNYLVRLPNSDFVWKRHTDLLIKGGKAAKVGLGMSPVGIT